ncbi:hypothetical protein OAG35_00690 [bacterium]|nr:hypothetical protein [bacterium]
MSTSASTTGASPRPRISESDAGGGDGTSGSTSNPGGVPGRSGSGATGKGTGCTFEGTSGVSFFGAGSEIGTDLLVGSFFPKSGAGGPR